METHEIARPIDVHPQSANFLTTRRDASFARGLLDQAVALFLAGESEATRLILRDLVTLTVGFEKLAALTNRSSKSLRAMLTSNGKPGMDGLSSIFRVIRDWLDVSLEVRVVDVASTARDCTREGIAMTVPAQPNYAQWGAAATAGTTVPTPTW
jgi:hypothetical protein